MRQESSMPEKFRAPGVYVPDIKLRAAGKSSCLELQGGESVDARNHVG